MDTKNANTKSTDAKSVDAKNIDVKKLVVQSLPLLKKFGEQLLVFLEKQRFKIFVTGGGIGLYLLINSINNHIGSSAAYAAGGFLAIAAIIGYKHGIYYSHPLTKESLADVKRTAELKRALKQERKEIAEIRDRISPAQLINN